MLVPTPTGAIHDPASGPATNIFNFVERNSWGRGRCPFVIPPVDPRMSCNPWLLAECEPTPLLTPALGRISLPAFGQPCHRHHQDNYNLQIPATLIWEGAPDELGNRPRAWIGSKHAAQNPDWLLRNGVGCVMSCTGFPLVKHHQRHTAIYYMDPFGHQRPCGR